MNFAGFLMNKVIALAVIAVVIMMAANMMDSSTFSLLGDVMGQDSILTAENSRTASRILNGGISDYITR